MTMTAPSLAVAEPSAWRQSLGLLWRDKFAFVAVLFLILVVLAACFGPWLFGATATKINLLARNAPPLSTHLGWHYVLGADSLGRSILARIIVGAQNTMMLAGCSVIAALLIGSLLGFIAGYRNDWTGSIIMRLADILMSFPSLLLAMIVLYVLTPASPMSYWCSPSPASRSICAPPAPRCWRSASAPSWWRRASWAPRPGGSCGSTSAPR